MKTISATLLALMLGLVPAGAQDATIPAPPAPAAPATNGNVAGQPQQTFDLPRVGDKDSQVKLVAGLCEIQMKAMSPLACKCLGEQAVKTLADPQRDYLIASVVAPPVADRMLKDGRVGAHDQQVIAAFLNTTSDACQSGVYRPTPAAGTTPTK